MRKIFATAVLAALLAAPSTAEAQVSVGPTVSYHNDFDFGVGAMVGADLPQLGEGVGLLGDFTYYFPSADGLNYLELNGNLTWDFPLEESPVSPFVLGGLNVARISVEGTTGFGSYSADQTEVGLNVGGGVGFSAGGVDPQVGLKAELSGGEGVVLFASVPFGLGG